MRSAMARRREGYEHEVEIREHRLIVDETEEKGGGDQGPTPTELLAASLATCTAITIEMYADFTQGTVDTPPRFKVEIRIPADLNDEQRERILVIAHKCPVHRTLMASDVEIDDSLELVEA